MSQIPIIRLADAPGERAAWSRPALIVYLWGFCELVFIHNPWQISSHLRVWMLRLFGAKIGNGVIFRPRTRVRFPWNLQIGDNSWIGEGVWFHNQNQIVIGHDVVISQETFLTTGSHAHRRDMELVTRPISVHAGVWLTSRCLVLGGVEIGRSALVKPGSVVDQSIPAGEIWSGVPAARVGLRFRSGDAA